MFEHKNNKGIDKENWLSLLRVWTLFHRYFSDEATAHEKNSIDTWEAFENEDALLKDKKLKKDCDTDLVWKTVTEKLQFDKLPKTKNKKYFIPNLRYAAAAAVVLILLAGGFLYFTQGDVSNYKASMQTADALIQTSDSLMQRITLPDGSKVHLNRGTKICYSTEKFNYKQREIWLEGEAFFDVAHNTEKPFIIHTGDITTTVRGTTFNVKAYPELNKNVITVVTGKVEVKSDNNLPTMLTSDKQLEYNKTTSESRLTDVDAGEVSNWQNGNLVLNYADRDELKLRIKQHFNMNVQFRNDALKGIRIKTTFVDGTPIFDIMGIIEALYGVDCKIADNQIIIDKQNN